MALEGVLGFDEELIPFQSTKPKDPSELARLPDKHNADVDELLGAKVIRWSFPIKEVRLSGKAPKVSSKSFDLGGLKWSFGAHFPGENDKNVNIMLKLDQEKVPDSKYRASSAVGFRDPNCHDRFLRNTKTKNQCLSQGRMGLLHNPACKYRLDEGVSLPQNDADFIQSDVVDVIFAIRVYQSRSNVPLFDDLKAAAKAPSVKAMQPSSANISTYNNVTKTITTPQGTFYKQNENSVMGPPAPPQQQVTKARPPNIRNDTSNNSNNNSNAGKTSTISNNSKTHYPPNNKYINNKNDNHNNNNNNGSNNNSPMHHNHQNGGSAAGLNNRKTLNFPPTVSPQTQSRSESPRTYTPLKRKPYVGLANQGATCYMNSILQSLFFVIPFRRAIGSIAKQDIPDPDRHVQAIKALSRVFDSLEKADDAVSTKALTKSFGWDSAFTFKQQDPQEFTRCFFEFLEDGIKKAGAENIINQMFEGEMEMRVQCKNITYASSRVETFNDIQLDVDGCRDLEASFQAFTAREDLIGDNQYRADDFGLQDAVKFIRFKTLPPVLHLQLKRFQYDVEKDSMRKIYRRHTFPDRMDLSQFNIPAAEGGPKTPQIYILQGVLVHSGGVHGGHYRAYLRPSVLDDWFEFDDGLVTRIPAKKVYEFGFGGEGSNKSAYMLIYVRESDMDVILEAEIAHQNPNGGVNGRGGVVDSPLVGVAANSIGNGKGKAAAVSDDTNGIVASANGYNTSLTAITTTASTSPSLKRGPGELVEGSSDGSSGDDSAGGDNKNNAKRVKLESAFVESQKQADSNKQDANGGGINGKDESNLTRSTRITDKYDNKQRPVKLIQDYTDQLKRDKDVNMIDVPDKTVGDDSGVNGGVGDMMVDVHANEMAGADTSVEASNSSDMLPPTPLIDMFADNASDMVVDLGDKEGGEDVTVPSTPDGDMV
ncbi:hypothetical protein SmJEL517_g03920 [Synchytrium microbalum]|uniref:Ubiquitin carboxyl-terminal hydrolase n=1 Tax=Synchytrium microbalum TaxID=1806994 RepID=A0A507C4M9_9FUNG|nr:uncharacterized protein SmJEL517_g03920 [Synchytrium microbalum]TPX33084.1 hypothetical protein SmJEL517_g03920 [Synchytrium microbalum]